MKEIDRENAPRCGFLVGAKPREEIGGWSMKVSLTIGLKEKNTDTIIGYLDASCGVIHCTPSTELEALFNIYPVQDALSVK